MSRVQLKLNLIYLRALRETDLLTALHLLQSISLLGLFPVVISIRRPSPKKHIDSIRHEGNLKVFDLKLKEIKFYSESKMGDLLDEDEQREPSAVKAR